MKLHHAFIVVSLAAAAACGSSDTTYTVSTGTYTISSVAAVGTDDCNLADFVPDGTPLGVTVDNGTATFRIGNEAPDATRNPVSTINGNEIGEGTKTYDSPSTVSSCIETITLDVSGEILADDEFSGTVKYSSRDSGNTGCTAAFLQYKVLPCASTITFQAKKQ
jgi:hypothetical protein